jgi:hypothetical protein
MHICKPATTKTLVVLQFWFVLCYGASIGLGTVFGSSFAGSTKGGQGDEGIGVRAGHVYTAVGG